MEDKKQANFTSNMSDNRDEFNIEDILFNDYDSRAMMYEEEKKEDPTP